MSTDLTKEDGTNIMAITETRNLPAPFIQALGEHYGKELPKLTGKELDTSQWAPTVAGQDQLQTQTQLH